MSMAGTLRWSTNKKEQKGCQKHKEVKEKFACSGGVIQFLTSVVEWCVDPHNVDCQNVIRLQPVCLTNVTSPVAIVHWYCISACFSEKQRLASSRLAIAFMVEVVSTTKVNHSTFKMGICQNQSLKPPRENLFIPTCVRKNRELKWALGE